MGNQPTVADGFSLAFSEWLSLALSREHNGRQLLKRVKCVLVKGSDQWLGRLLEERYLQRSEDVQSPSFYSRLVRWLFESLVTQETPSGVSCHFTSVPHQ